MTATPFTDPGAHARLYKDPGRLARRTGALHAAKISGRDAAVTIADLTVESQPGARLVADIGCGRGTSTLRLSQRLHHALIVGIDRSAALLDTARRRHGESNLGAVEIVCADFHHLPVGDARLDAAVAAFCLYHSARPAAVVAEIARCLVPGGAAVFATKSADSYRELDGRVAGAGLDPAATTRPSLYATFHSTNAPAIVAESLHLRHVEHEQHQFQFHDAGHLAAYLATTPTYTIDAAIAGHPDRLAQVLNAGHTDWPVTTTSTVTYIVASRQ
jgi:SAM-dependent methyltransferase